MAKRFFLFALVNILVVTTISVILAVFHVGDYFPEGGLGGLAVFCLIYGMGAAFISLLLSRFMAKMLMGVKVIPTDTNNPELLALVNKVHQLAQSAGLRVMPEVGIYESPDINAFATGPSKSRSLVAVSTGLLQNLNTSQTTAVLGHEITHITNGDMVTMTLLQGVINAFVMFLARVLAFVITQAMRGRNERGGGFIQFLLVIIFQIVFSILGSLVVLWFSRQREFRADAGGARLAGRDNMIDALRALDRLHNEKLSAMEAKQAPAFQCLKISAPDALNILVASHPPIEQRIARLQAGVE